ncbi:hypothetical protein ACFQMM_18440 [Saliphagus sp. GCM10025308]
MRPVLVVLLVIVLLAASVGTVTVGTIGTVGTVGTASASVDSSASHRHLLVDSSDGRVGIPGTFSGTFTGNRSLDTRDDSRACPVRAATAFSGDGHLSDAIETSDSEPRTEPHVSAVYPNPTTHGNVGEFFVLEVPAQTRLENWTVTDGHTTAAIPNATVSGPVALSMDPDETASMTTLEVLELEGHLRLAADGDILRVLQDGTLVDEVTYDRARTARVWYRSEPDATAASTTPDQDAWWPRGATCLPVAAYGETAGTAFVLPDAPDVARERITDADDRIRLAGYTFTSPEVATALEGALERGIDTTILSTPSSTKRSSSPPKTGRHRDWAVPRVVAGASSSRIVRSPATWRRSSGPMRTAGTSLRGPSTGNPRRSSSPIQHPGPIQPSTNRNPWLSSE